MSSSRGPIDYNELHQMRREKQRQEMRDWPKGARRRPLKKSSVYELTKEEVDDLVAKLMKSAAKSQKGTTSSKVPIDYWAKHQMLRNKQRQRMREGPKGARQRPLKQSSVYEVTKEQVDDLVAELMKSAAKSNKGTTSNKELIDYQKLHQMRREKQRQEMRDWPKGARHRPLKKSSVYKLTKEEIDDLTTNWPPSQFTSTPNTSPEDEPVEMLPTSAVEDPFPDIFDDIQPLERLPGRARPPPRRAPGRRPAKM
jgi:ribosomal protein L11